MGKEKSGLLTGAAVALSLTLAACATTDKTTEGQSGQGAPDQEIVIPGSEETSAIKPPFVVPIKKEKKQDGQHPVVEHEPG